MSAIYVGMAESVENYCPHDWHCALRYPRGIPRSRDGVRRKNEHALVVGADGRAGGYQVHVRRLLPGLRQRQGLWRSSRSAHPWLDDKVTVARLHLCRKRLFEIFRIVYSDPHLRGGIERYPSLRVAYIEEREVIGPNKPQKVYSSVLVKAVNGLEQVPFALPSLLPRCSVEITSDVPMQVDRRARRRRCEWCVMLCLFSCLLKSIVRWPIGARAGFRSEERNWRLLRDGSTGRVGNDR